MSILELFVSVDTFWQQFERIWEREQLATGRRRKRATRLSMREIMREIMTIAILFQQSGYRTFKAFYTQHVQVALRAEFPGLVSYTRFVELLPRAIVPLMVYLHTQLGSCTGVSFVDSTGLKVCHNARIHQHRVFQADARRGKTSVGWFYGFKLHLVVNDRGDLLAFCLLPHSRASGQRGRPPPPASPPTSPRASPRAPPLWQTVWRQRLSLCAAGRTPPGHATPRTACS